MYKTGDLACFGVDGDSILAMLVVAGLKAAGYPGVTIADAANNRTVAEHAGV